MTSQVSPSQIDRSAPTTTEGPDGAESRAGTEQSSPGVSDDTRSCPPDRRPPGRVYALAAGSYLLLSLILWWHVLPHPRSVTTCGCGDGALTLWVIKWPAYALSHGLNPFYSSKLLVPRGINMAPNSLGLGIVTAPVTWIFGPVASLNLIDLASPALSALAMFWLLRRWVQWAPAAFIGGLFFGFSPFALVSLALAHPNFGMLAPVPLIVGCIDDLLFRHRFRPLRVGIALGLLVAIEFFISVEVLLIMVLFAGLALVGAGLWSAVTGRGSVRGQARTTAPAFGVAAGVVVALLAYPLWFFFAGPAHLVGRAWPNSPSGTVTNSPGQFVDGYISAPLTGIMHAFGGYQGPTLPLLGFLGIGMVVVLVGGVVLCRRDRLLQTFALLGLVAAILSLGVTNAHWTPWRLFTHLPVLNNVVPVNISVIVDTCAAIVLARVIDQARSGARQHFGPRWGAMTGLIVGAVAVVPITVALWPNIPMTVRPVAVPQWFAQTAPSAGSHLVVLPYPAALGGIQSSMAWQAMEGMTFSMVGGGGPGIAPSRAGAERPGFDVLARASLPLGPAPAPTSANLRAIRQALAGWGVTTIVVPDQPSLPSYDHGRPIPYAIGLLSAALGRAPTLASSAWVWNDVGRSGASRPVSAVRFTQCTSGTGNRATAPAVAACVLQGK
jgi:hypothetical protein